MQRAIVHRASGCENIWRQFSIRFSRSAEQPYCSNDDSRHAHQYNPKIQSPPRFQTSAPRVQVSSSRSTLSVQHVHELPASSIRNARLLACLPVMAAEHGAPEVKRVCLRCGSGRSVSLCKEFEDGTICNNPWRQRRSTFVPGGSYPQHQE